LPDARQSTSRRPRSPTSHSGGVADLPGKLKTTGREESPLEHGPVEEIAPHRPANEDRGRSVEADRRSEVDADVPQGQAATHPLGVDEQRGIVDRHRYGETATLPPRRQRSEAPASVGATTGMHDRPYDPHRCDPWITCHQVLECGAARDPHLLDRDQRIPVGRLG